MVKFGKSEPAISPEHYRKIFQEALRGFYNKQIGCRALEVITKEYGPKTIDKAVETERKARTKELMLEYKAKFPTDFENIFKDTPEESLGMITDWDLPAPVRAGLNDIDNFACAIEDWEMYHGTEMNTVITDPATGRHMRVRDFEAKYKTTEWTNALLKASKDGHIPYGVAKAIKAKNNALERDSSEVPNELSEASGHKGKRDSKSRRTIREPPFIAVRHLFIDRLSNSSCHKNPTATLLYLLKHRGYEGKQDTHATGENWYSKKKLIVASIGHSKMMRELGIDRSTVKRHIHKLVKNRDIEVVSENDENVYILGYVEPSGHEQFFYQGRHDC